MKDLPILSMRLENVARDFHMRIIENHNEVQKYIEENLPKMLAEFIEKELPKLTSEMIKSACRDATYKKMRHDSMQEQIEQAVAKAIDNAAQEIINEELEDYEIQEDFRDKIKASKFFKFWELMFNKE